MDNIEEINNNEKSTFYNIILNIFEFINHYIYTPCMNVFMSNSVNNLDKNKIINTSTNSIKLIDFNDNCCEKYINLFSTSELITDLDTILENIVPDKSLYKIE
jgi:hypothetical protein